MDCARKNEVCTHPIPTAPGVSHTSLEQRISYLENEVEYWNKRYQDAQTRADEAEAHMSAYAEAVEELKQEGTPSERKVLASVGTPRRMGRVEKDSVELGNDQDTCPTGVPISTTEESRNDYISKLEAIIERQGEIINQQMKELSRPDCKEKCRHRDDCNYPRCMPGEEEDG